MSERPYVLFAEVKEKVTIPDVLEALGIAEQFKRKGNGLSGVCCLPFHEHGPAPNPEQFRIGMRDGISVFHCFGDCQRGGDVIEFIRLMTGLSHAHTRLWIAERFGSRLSTRKPRGRNGPTAKREARPVRQTPEQAESKTLRRPKVSDSKQTIKPLRFRLNLEPDVPYLWQRGLTAETIGKYGLGLCRRGLLEAYVAIPVFRHPPDENPVAYLGRWPGEDFDAEAGRPRYKWPQGFEKSKVVYGLNEALASDVDQPLIVVEGCFAVYHLVQCGFPTTVATFGASLSDDQADLLADTGRQIILMYDGNETGQQGMQQAAAKLISRTLVRAIRLELDQQPDDLSADELKRRLQF